MADAVVARKQLVACWCFLFGPVGKDDWAMACVEAGYSGVRGPSRDSESTLEAFEIVKDLQRRAAELPEDEDVAAIQRAVAEGLNDWAYLAPYARRVMAKIGSGRLAGSSQQMTALKEILLRAEGKAGVEKKGKEEEEGVGILLLPVVVRAGIPVVDLSDVREVEDDA